MRDKLYTYPLDKLLNWILSDNIKLSTMHGCPPDEIESIVEYLITERKLHTAVKLNPTLLGKEKLRDILNIKFGYETVVPDEAFEHDLKWDEAVSMIERLTVLAEKHGVEFGLKLTNTLESLNSTELLPQKENMVYMSGRHFIRYQLTLLQNCKSSLTANSIFLFLLELMLLMWRRR